MTNEAEDLAREAAEDLENEFGEDLAEKTNKVIGGENLESQEKTRGWHLQEIAAGAQIAHFIWMAAPVVINRCKGWTSKDEAQGEIEKEVKKPDGLTPDQYKKIIQTLIDKAFGKTG